MGVLKAGYPTIFTEMNKEVNWQKYAEQLRNALIAAPIGVMYSRTLYSIPLEYRKKVHEFLEREIANNLSRISKEHGLE